MAAAQHPAETTVRDFIARVKPDAGEIDLDTPLYADGVGLDSLESAELSAVLEDELGSDPFTSDELPQTLREIVAFYASTDTAGDAVPAHA